MVDKEKLTKKYKLIFLVEYLLISAILLTIGLLKVFNVIEYNDKRLLVYNIITLIGVAYITFDLVWNLVSKKKRESLCIIDKVFPGIAALYLLVFDILVLGKFYTNLEFIKYSIGAVLIYAGSVSLGLGIYHHFKPSKQILEAIDEAYEEKLKEQEEDSKKDESAE